MKFFKIGETISDGKTTTGYEPEASRIVEGASQYTVVVSEKYVSRDYINLAKPDYRKTIAAKSIDEAISYAMNEFRRAYPGKKINHLHVDDAGSVDVSLI